MSSAHSQAQQGARDGSSIPQVCDIALFVAVAEEAAALKPRVRPHLIGSDGRLHGDWSGRSVRIQETGPGLVGAEAAARRMLGAVRPRLVICAGLAGGLHPAFERGAVVVADHVVAPHGGEKHGGDDRILQAAVALGARRGVLLSAPHVVCTVEEKRALSGRAAFVDMESLAVARVAAEFDVPFVAVRVISDAANEGFPIDLNRYVDSQGRIRRTALALAALRRRGGLQFLLGLRAAALHGSQALAGFLEELIKVV